MTRVLILQSIPNLAQMVTKWVDVMLVGTWTICAGVVFTLWPHALIVVLGHVAAALFTYPLLRARSVYVFNGLCGSLLLWLNAGGELLPAWVLGLGWVLLILAIVCIVVGTAAHKSTSRFGRYLLVGGTILIMEWASLSKDPIATGETMFWISVGAYAIRYMVFAYYRRLQRRATGSRELPTT